MNISQKFLPDVEYELELALDEIDVALTLIGDWNKREDRRPIEWPRLLVEVHRSLEEAKRRIDQTGQLGYGHRNLDEVLSRIRSFDMSKPRPVSTDWLEHTRESIRGYVDMAIDLIDQGEMVAGTNLTDHFCMDG